MLLMQNSLDCWLLYFGRVESRITNGRYCVTKGINDDDVLQDAADILLMLNDNDIYELKRQKEKKINQFNKQINQLPLPGTRQRNYTIIDNDTGEIL